MGHVGGRAGGRRRGCSEERVNAGIYGVEEMKRRKKESSRVLKKGGADLNVSGFQCIGGIMAQPRESGLNPTAVNKSVSAALSLRLHISPGSPFTAGAPSPDLADGEFTDSRVHRRRGKKSSQSLHVSRCDRELRFQADQSLLK